MSKRLDEIFALVRKLESPGADFTREQLDDDRLCDAARRDSDTFRKVVGIVEQLGNIINLSGNEPIIRAGIFVGLIKTHRYLEQNLITCILESLGDLGLAAREDHHRYTDGRNEFAMSLCKKLRETFKDELFWKDGFGG